MTVLVAVAIVVVFIVIGNDYFQWMYNTEFSMLYQMCSIDKQLEGTLPAYVFSLLAIYYLQQCTPPVLPVLHEVLSSFVFASASMYFFYL